MRILQTKGSLPRSVHAVHILFSLLAVISLYVGASWVGERSRNEAFGKTRLAKTQRAESRLVVSNILHGSEHFQDLVVQFKLENNLANCAIVGTDGTFIAHSTPELIGEVSREPMGTRTEQGGVAELQYMGANGESWFRRTSIDLRDPSKKRLGTLQLVFRDLGSIQSAMNIAVNMPIILLLPFAFILAGGYLVGRVVQSASEIQWQLKKFASSTEVSVATFEPVTAKDATSIGWNRLVAELKQIGPDDSRTNRLNHALENYQLSRSQNLLESLPIGIAETDIDGQIMFINNAMESILGLEAGHALGGSIDQCLTLDEAHRQKLFGQYTLDRTVAVEMAKQASSGDRILRVSRHPIRESNSQQLSGQAWAIRDVTQMKLADKARDDFLDAATHEIRTPLANIKAYAETLALNDIPDVEQHKEFCNVINSEATRLARFIDELLDVSSLEAGSLVVKCQKIELSRLLDDVIANVQPMMEQKSLVFQQEFDAKLPEIAVDKDKFSTCLINLLGNAAKYTPLGGGVTLRARVHERVLSIEVVDTGFGIAKDELPKVFEKFFRSDDERVTAQTGSGLGLAFTKEIILLHGGNLVADSELNKGSTFTISLPLS